MAREGFHTSSTLRERRSRSDFPVARSTSDVENVATYRVGPESNDRRRWVPAFGVPHPLPVHNLRCYLLLAGRRARLRDAIQTWPVATIPSHSNPNRTGGLWTCSFNRF